MRDRPGAAQTKSAPRHKWSNSEVERLLLKMEDEWMMSPREPYEIIGDVGYVLFPCGQVVDELAGEIRLYYGAADSSIAVAHGNISEVVDWLMKR